MATVRGLGAVRVGDAIGEPPPGERRVRALPASHAGGGRVRGPSEQQGSLRAALNQLAEQDPLIDVRQDDHRHEIAVSLYGEVQKEVIGATLERDYGIAADFRETTVLCIERPARLGAADEVIRSKTKTNIVGRSSPDSTNPFMATLGLRIEPAASGTAPRCMIGKRTRPRRPPFPATQMVTPRPTARRSVERSSASAARRSLSTRPWRLRKAAMPVPRRRMSASTEPPACRSTGSDAAQQPDWRHTIRNTATGEIVGGEACGLPLAELTLDDRSNLAALGAIKHRLADAVDVAERAASGKAISGGLVRERGRLNFAIVVISAATTSRRSSSNRRAPGPNSGSPYPAEKPLTGAKLSRISSRHVHDHQTHD